MTALVCRFPDTHATVQGGVDLDEAIAEIRRRRGERSGPLWWTSSPRSLVSPHGLGIDAAVDLERTKLLAELGLEGVHTLGLIETRIGDRARRLLGEE